MLLFLAKARQKDMMKDVLSNVDSEGSTLLHLAVDSGSPAVRSLLHKFLLLISLCLLSHLFDFSTLFQVVELCLNNEAIIRQPKVSD